MDSIYPSMLVHVHGAIWKERWLLTLESKDFKHAKEVLQLLEEVNLPDQVTIMHFPENQRDGSRMSQESQTADDAVKQAAEKLPHVGVLICWLDSSIFLVQDML